MRCEDCKNHKQITKEEFDSLPYEKQRQLDCKNLTGDGGQCDCYSKEHHPEEFTLQIKIMETDDAFVFENDEDFENVFANPYVTLAKKVQVEGVGEVEFDVYDFIKLLDLSWNTEGRLEKVLLRNVGESKDYRHSYTTVLTWEKRNVNCKGSDRKGLWTVLVMSFIKKDIWELIKG